MSAGFTSRYGSTLVLSEFENSLNTPDLSEIPLD
jgi:hypothetical protein